tara:strand:+ start:120 stop:440 length:321 start_codon:yes stop_codon:yes gene_type:complete
MDILTPDKSNYLLKKYHLSNKILLPGLLLSYGLNSVDYVDNKYKRIGINFVNFSNIINVGIHSYVSTSSILSDYVKPKNISKVLRVSSLGLHALAICGLCKYFKKS